MAAASTAADAEAKSGRPWEERGEIRAIGDGGCFCSLCRPSGIAERLGEEAARAPSPRLFGVPEPPEENVPVEKAELAVPPSSAVSGEDGDSEPPPTERGVVFAEEPPPRRPPLRPLPNAIGSPPLPALIGPS